MDEEMLIRMEDIKKVFLTDGRTSHRQYLDGDALAARRRDEAVAACAVLGVPATDVHFLGYPDGELGAHLAAVAEASGVSPQEMVFHMGGDFELLFTLPEEKVGDLEKEMDFTIIGTISNDRGKIVTPSGSQEDLSSRGYEAFMT